MVNQARTKTFLGLCFLSYKDFVLRAFLEIGLHNKESPHNRELILSFNISSASKY